MTSKLVPADPSKVCVIRKVTPNITTCSAPFSRFGYVKVGGRGTIVRLRSGALAVFSPTALTPEVRATVNGLGGNVAYLAAPDMEHHIFLSEWSKAYPSARVIGMEGLPEKREASPQTAGTKFTWLFTQKNKDSLKIGPEFDAEFHYEYVDSHPNKELVFCHKPEKTLIEADLLFNLPANEQYSKSDESPTSGRLTQIFNKLQNTEGAATAQKRFIWHAISRGNRDGFSRSMKRIDSWDFNRIIPCHGDVIETGGKDIFRKVMEWHLQSTKN